MSEYVDGRLSQLLAELLGSTTETAVRRLLEGHPELLTDRAEVLLELGVERLDEQHEAAGANLIRGFLVLPRRNLDSGLAGGRLRRSGAVRISSYFRTL
jgi:hypothetical protein